MPQAFFDNLTIVPPPANRGAAAVAMLPRRQGPQPHQYILNTLWMT